MNLNLYPKKISELPKKGNVVTFYDKSYVCHKIIYEENKFDDYDVYILWMILNNTKYGIRINIEKGLFTEKEVLEHFNNV